MGIRAVVLVSGRLDSLLAAKLLEAQAIEVVPLSIGNGFARRGEALDDGPYARPVRRVDATEAFVRGPLVAPRHGYGPGFAPCLDCRVLMLRIAATVAAEEGAAVIATGEVLGQHPVSQTHAGFATAEREADLPGRVLRPLSALLLEPTEAERSGAVDRSRLGRIHGRTRAAQEAMARTFGIEGVPAASRRCCLLPDRGFARRVRDLVEHADPAAIDRPVLERLQVGRHLRLGHDLKVVVSRNDEEGRFLETTAGDRWIGGAESGRGALGVVEGEPDAEGLARAAAAIARYHGGDAAGSIRFRRGGTIVRLARPFGPGGRVL